MTKAVRDLIKFAAELEQKIEEAPPTMRSPESGEELRTSFTAGNRVHAESFLHDIKTIVHSAPGAIAYLSKELQDTYPKGPERLPTNYYKSAELLANFLEHLAKL